MLLEIGCVSTANTVNLLLKNVLDMCVAFWSWWAVGYAISSTGGSDGFFSISGASATSADISAAIARLEWLFGAAFAATSATIMSGVLGPRITISGYASLASAVTAWVYPMAAYWTWGDGWASMGRENPLFGCGVVDFAGTVVVHALGGMAGLVAAAFIGPRIGRFTEDDDEEEETADSFLEGTLSESARKPASGLVGAQGRRLTPGEENTEVKRARRNVRNAVKATVNLVVGSKPQEQKRALEDSNCPNIKLDQSLKRKRQEVTQLTGDLSKQSPTFRILGTMILFLGWNGFNGVSTLTLQGDSPQVAAIVLFNTTLAACSSGMTISGLSLILRGHIDVDDIGNGMLAGLVAITGCCPFVHESDACIIGAIASPLYFVSSIALDRFRIDDVVSAIPVHLTAGIWGAIAPGLLAAPHLLELSAGMDEEQARECSGVLYAGNGSLLAANICHVLAICAWASVSIYPIIRLLIWLDVYRVSAEYELTGLDIALHTSRYDMKDLKRKKGSRSRSRASRSNNRSRGGSWRASGEETTIRSGK